MLPIPVKIEELKALIEEARKGYQELEVKIESEDEYIIRTLKTAFLASGISEIRVITQDEGFKVIDLLREHKHTKHELEELGIKI